MKIKFFTWAFLVSAFILFLITTQSAQAFPEVISPEVLRARYTAGQKIKIVLVPGHDDDYTGTQFRGVKEADMNAVLTEKLAAILKKDPKFDVIIARTLGGGYNATIWDYIDLNRATISEFIKTHKQAMTDNIQSGSVQETISVPHNNAQPEVATRLFGINKWSNENNVDLVIHVHFDDYPGRPWNGPGEYQGLTVYIPEGQYGNARASRAIGQSVFTQLTKYYPKSTYGPESAGLVEDQDLIALGTSNTLNAASILTEYGYIYEPQFLNETIRNKMLGDLAYQTAIGVESFFGAQAKYQNKFGTTLLPHTWSTTVNYGAKNSGEVLALQAALRKEGLYPLAPATSYDCPITGTFGPCTQKSLKAFQVKYKIPATGVLGPLTRAKLNSLFSK